MNAPGLRLSRLLLVALIVLTILGCDQVTKHVARQSLAPGASISLLRGIVTLTLAENTGAFLSLGAGMSPTLRAIVFTWGVGLILLAGAVYLILSGTEPPLVVIGGALVVGGGLGNLIDRFVFDGRVTDFLLLELGPLRTGIFNVADMAVMLGLAVLLISQHRTKRKTPGPTAA